MNRDEVLNWFTEVAKPQIENNRGLFCTFYYVYDDDRDPYYFTIEFQPYSCGVDWTEDGCNDCPYRTIHGNCGEKSLYINLDGSISYDDENYTEDRFEEFLSEFI